MQAYVGLNLFRHLQCYFTIEMIFMNFQLLIVVKTVTNILANPFFVCKFQVLKICMSVEKMALCEMVIFIYLLKGNSVEFSMHSIIHYSAYAVNNSTKRKLIFGK